jgi:hypothetical protein
LRARNTCNTTPIPLRIAAIDTCVVISILLLYVVLEALRAEKRWSFLAVGVAVAVYTIYLVVRHPHSWHDLGFRVDNLRVALLPFASFTLAACVALVGWGLVHGQPAWTPQVGVLLAVYPVWAVVQQLAFQGLLHRGLMVLIRSPVLQVLIAAAAFAAVHAGNGTLVALTFTAGVSWSLLYRRWPNIWLLAASHTILAALVYPLVLKDEPLSRI